MGWGRDELVLMYSGNMGLGHRFHEFLQVAAETSHDHGLRWVFAGGGKRRGEVERFAAQRPAARVQLMPYASADRLREHLCAADVHLVSLEAGWQGCMMPSKIQNVFAAGRPVIYVGPLDNSLARWILDAGAGWAVPANDIEGLARAIGETRDARERAVRGAAARRYAEAYFDRETNASRICEWLEAAGPGAESDPPDR